MVLTDTTRTGNELTVLKYTTTLEDVDGNALTLASIDTAKLTLYNVADGSIINSRTAQDVKNANQVVIHATSGLLTWDALPADSPIVGTPSAGEPEKHVAMFDIVYSTTQRLLHTVTLYVNQVTKAP